MARDKDNYNAWMRAWRLQNRSKVSAGEKSWRIRNKEYLKERCKEWKLANPDKVKAHSRAKYQRNKSKYKLKSKEYRKANKDKVRKWEKTMRDKNPQRYKEKRKRHWQRVLKKQDESASKPRPMVCEFGCGRGPVVWDHDEPTQTWRSWPCKFCNTAMGLVYHRPDVLRRLADCVDEHRKRHQTANDQVQLPVSTDPPSV